MLTCRVIKKKTQQTPPKAEKTQHKCQPHGTTGGNVGGQLKIFGRTNTDVLKNSLETIYPVIVGLFHSEFDHCSNTA